MNKKWETKLSTTIELRQRRNCLSTNFPNFNQKKLTRRQIVWRRIRFRRQFVRVDSAQTFPNKSVRRSNISQSSQTKLPRKYSNSIFFGHDKLSFETINDLETAESSWRKKVLSVRKCEVSDNYCLPNKVCKLLTTKSLKSLKSLFGSEDFRLSSSANCLAESKFEINCTRILINSAWSIFQKFQIVRVRQTFPAELSNTFSWSHEKLWQTNTLEPMKVILSDVSENSNFCDGTVLRNLILS